MIKSEELKKYLDFAYFVTSISHDRNFNEKLEGSMNVKMKKRNIANS